MSLCPVFTPFSLGKGGQQARQTDLILNLPVPPLTLYSYRYGITITNLYGRNIFEEARDDKRASAMFTFA